LLSRRRDDETSDGSAQECFFEIPNQRRRRSTDVSLLSGSDGSDKNSKTSSSSNAGSDGDPSAGNLSPDESKGFNIPQEDLSDSDFQPSILDSPLQPIADMEEERDGAPDGVRTIESHVQEQSQQIPLSPVHVV
jgi:hypothetical protein